MTTWDEYGAVTCAVSMEACQGAWIVAAVIVLHTLVGLGENFLDDVSVYIRQAALDAVVIERQTSVVDP